MAIAAAPVNRTNVNTADSRHYTKIPITLYGVGTFFVRIVPSWRNRFTGFSFAHRAHNRIGLKFNNNGNADNNPNR